MGVLGVGENVVLSTSAAPMMEVLSVKSLVTLELGTQEGTARVYRVGWWPRPRLGAQRKEHLPAPTLLGTSGLQGSAPLGHGQEVGDQTR